MADIVLINPRFDISYWGLEHAMPFLGAKAVLPVASLPLLAALTPAGHRVTLIDENVESIDFARCARADLRARTRQDSLPRWSASLPGPLSPSETPPRVTGPWPVSTSW